MSKDNVTVSISDTVVEVGKLRTRRLTVRTGSYNRILITGNEVREQVFTDGTWRTTQYMELGK